MIAAMCEYPQATHVSAAVMKEGKLEVTREIDGGYEVLDLTLPAVVTADLRLNAPRYVTLPMMMKAKRKPQEVCLLYTSQANEELIAAQEKYGMTRH